VSAERSSKAYVARDPPSYVGVQDISSELKVLLNTVQSEGASAGPATVYIQVESAQNVH